MDDLSQCVDCGAPYVEDDMAYLTTHAECDWCGDEHCFDSMTVVSVKPTDVVDDPNFPWMTTILCHTCHPQYLIHHSKETN